MAYFDSAKNRALWEKEMVGLRKERARRAEIIKNGGSLEVEEKPVEKAPEERIMREKTSYAELLKEEMQATNAKKPVGKTKAMTKSIERNKDLSKNGPQLSGI